MLNSDNNHGDIILYKDQDVSTHCTDSMAIDGCRKNTMTRFGNDTGNISQKDRYGREGL